MNLKQKLTALLLLAVEAVTQLNAQVAVTVGSQVTDASSIVSGKAYLLRWDGLIGTPYALDTGGDVYSMANNNSATQVAVYYLISDGTDIGFVKGYNSQIRDVDLWDNEW